MNARKGTELLFICLLTILWGCAGARLKLEDWRKLPEEHYSIPPYARHLTQFKIALDPGHGGNAHLPGYKRGPSGKREAIMNLKVAQFLQEFLEKAGVEVFLTREDDRFVSLQERVDLAHEAKCDFLISLHHNASANPETNYSAVFYHLTPDYSPVSIDLARNIYFGLVEALRLPQVVDDGLLTDKIIYPAGFGLLRRSRIPAILLESSFYSNPEEEKRLTEWRYNRREAYGIFLGLARWAAGGVPSAVMTRPGMLTTDKQPQIEYRLYDGITEHGGRNLDELLIFSESVTASIDSKSVQVELTDDKKIAAFRPDSMLGNGPHAIRVDLQNMFKNHNFPRLDTLTISAPTDSIHFEIASQYLPADTMAMLPIRLALFDEYGELVWDSTTVELQVNRGRINPARPRLSQGRATVVYRPDSLMGLVYLTADARSHSDTLLLSLIPPGQSWTLGGHVKEDSSANPITAATVILNDSIATQTDDNGIYFFLKPPLGATKMRVTKDGYEPVARGVVIDSSRSQFIDFDMRAHFDGILHDKILILDATGGHSVPGDVFSDSLTAADASLHLARSVANFLKQAGAQAILVREDEQWLPSEARIEKVNAVQGGWYLKLGYEKWDSDSIFVQTTIYPANKIGESIANHILQAFSHVPAMQGTLLQNTKVPEVTYTNKTAVEVIIRCRQPEVRQRDLPQILAAIVSFTREAKREAKSPEADAEAGTF